MSPIPELTHDQYDSPRPPLPLPNGRINDVSLAPWFKRTDVRRGGRMTTRRIDEADEDGALAMPLQRFPAWSNHVARGWRRGSAARTTTTNTDNITHAHRYVSRFNVYHTGSNTWAHAKSFSLIIIIIKVHHHHHHHQGSSSSSSRFIIIIIIIKVHHHHYHVL